MLKVLLSSPACHVGKYQTVPLSRHHVMQMHEEQEIRLHWFLIQSLKESELLASHPNCFTLVTTGQEAGWASQSKGKHTFLLLLRSEPQLLWLWSCLQLHAVHLAKHVLMVHPCISLVINVYFLSVSTTLLDTTRSLKYWWRYHTQLACETWTEHSISFEVSPCQIRSSKMPSLQKQQLQANLSAGDYRHVYLSKGTVTSWT